MFDALKSTTFPVLAGVLLLLGGNVAYAWGPQNASLTMTGGVVSPGVEAYSMSGGQTMSALVLGTQVPTMNSQLYYSLNAMVSGLTATGSASFDFVARSSPGARMEVKGFIRINSMTPAVLFPLGCTPGAGCTSAIPALFNGIASISVTTSGGQNGNNNWNNNGITMSLPIEIESPYLNPFGGPILIATGSDEIVLVATYSQARIQWTGVQMGGSVQGTIAGASVSGSFGMVVNSAEDLVSGVEFDHGSIAFFGMSSSSDDASGTFIGFSAIPHGSTLACSGFPPGTCFETGLQSSGVFSQTTVSGQWLSGTYSTSWNVPAVTFTSSVSGTLK